MNARDIAILAKTISEDKQGINPIILDLRKLTDIADYFVLVNGNSDRHVRAISDAICEGFETRALRPHHVEGLSESQWVLLDYGSVMVHVFHHRTRTFYNLERLWGDAKIVRIRKKDEKSGKKTRRRRASRNHC